MRAMCRVSGLEVQVAAKSVCLPPGIMGEEESGNMRLVW